MSRSPQTKSNIFSFSGKTIIVVKRILVLSFTTSVTPYTTVFVLGPGSAATTSGGGECLDLCLFCAAFEVPVTSNKVRKTTEIYKRDCFIVISHWPKVRALP